MSVSGNRWVESIQVVFTDKEEEQPANRVKELRGGATSINAGFRGKYVSFLLSYTPDPTLATTSFFVVVQRFALDDFEDLAKGAGGDYRHLVPVYDQSIETKITELMLYRSAKEMTGAERENMRSLGYSGVSENFNKGRGGDFLYLMWKTKDAI
ncbi:hypothetical protein WOLCODRAFT_162586 [Wolfiporia cocos MD-104 SS10]|uniref:Uncharacterized protein n=1 Tax=Wolfiporia cocos (strain MD-104) TaxID=742152 RepID=A0A2H3JPW4_WOLCO|nr:hypothetical protein WOLCODRAFT_162586 [Wolfiporia cocos MD-104 SS10]